MPHMHERGVRQTRCGPAGGMSCASRIENWDFHWQEFYFYQTPIPMTPTSQVEVTCEYDTSRDTTPVLPGWGTRNEMCLNVLMVALPPAEPRYESARRWRRCQSSSRNTASSAAARPLPRNALSR